MKCPVCDGSTRTYATKVFETIKLRYRKCIGCGRKYRSFEELDTETGVRECSAQKADRGSADRVSCPVCGGSLSHTGPVHTADGILPSLECTACRTAFKRLGDGQLSQIETRVFKAEIGHRVLP